MVNDVISDCLTRIRNASLSRRYEVKIPKARSCQKICNILKQEGFIENISNIPGDSKQFSIFLKYKGINEDPCITNLRRISKPGVRIYTSYKEMPEVLGGMGLLILSTSRGILTNKEARLYGIGGEILCSVW